jgi:hypothetical protein
MFDFGRDGLRAVRLFIPEFATRKKIGRDRARPSRLNNPKSEVETRPRFEVLKPTKSRTRTTCPPKPWRRRSTTTRPISEFRNLDNDASARLAVVISH